MREKKTLRANIYTNIYCFCLYQTATNSWILFVSIERKKKTFIENKNHFCYAFFFCNVCHSILNDHVKIGTVSIISIDVELYISNWMNRETKKLLNSFNMLILDSRRMLIEKMHLYGNVTITFRFLTLSFDCAVFFNARFDSIEFALRVWTKIAFLSECKRNLRHGIQLSVFGISFEFQA